MSAKREPKIAKITGLKPTDDSEVPMLKVTNQTQPVTGSKGVYSRFDEINGWHPWMESMPGSYITYPVRELPGTNVAYFNFQLAKEMGLIPHSHPEKMTSDLEKKIKETFSLQIINEYDQIHRRRFPENTIKPNEYMATRYLQLQHLDKTGRTSGDGRSIWNGVIENNGKIWDVSSRGTGVTALAPGAVEANKPLRTGSEEVGYGCGLAEIDELFASAILSEIFHNHGINTERVLTVIDMGKGVGIGVRVGQNLMRPAHFFNHLKQGDAKAVERALDYMIDRQHKNGTWKFSTRHPKKYQFLLDTVCESYAKFAATLDVDYIFAWLDWDGDNVLADAGIIDYGSIRQFGLRHDQYRYDDVSRFSTNLNEQKLKAKQIVQAFVQAVHFVTSGEKKTLKTFEDHHVVQKFHSHFEHYRLSRILFRSGFDESNCKFLLSDHKNLVVDYANEYNFIESRKSAQTIELSDGINKPAILNIRNLLRELPARMRKADDFESFEIACPEFYEIMFAEEVAEEDRKITNTMVVRAKNFQHLYKKMIKTTRRRRSNARMLEDLDNRSQKINNPNRVTGNGVVHIVDEILKARKGKLQLEDVHNVIHKFLQKQCLDPDNPYHRQRVQFREKQNSEQLLNSILTVVKEHNEDI